MKLSTQTRLEADELMKLFFVPLNLDDDAKPIRDLLPQLSQSFVPVAETFIDRLNATIQTTSAPYLLAGAASHNKRYQLFSAAARIRAGSIVANAGEDGLALEARRNAVASESAHTKMEAFSNSDEGWNALISDTVGFLLHLYKTSDIQSVSRELLLQGTVSTWSALEMLLGDGMTLLLDSRPDLVAKLLSDPNAKKRFEIPKFSIEDLTSRGFNLSNQMGHLLFSDRDLSNFATIKCACEALMNSPDLTEKLSSPTAWQLNQNRHLIVHRRGVVDEEYLRKTGTTLKLGEQLVVSPDVFEEQFRQALAIGEAFLRELAVISNTQQPMGAADPFALS